MLGFMMNHQAHKFTALQPCQILECMLYLQDDPVAFPCSQIEGLFSYNLLALTQGHVVKVVVVKCEAHLLPWRITCMLYIIYTQVKLN